MANNRIYLVDKETKEYLCLAKGYGHGWSVGNVNLYEEFMRTRYSDSHGKVKVIGGVTYEVIGGDMLFNTKTNRIEKL